MEKACQNADDYAAKLPPTCDCLSCTDRWARKGPWRSDEEFLARLLKSDHGRPVCRGHSEAIGDDI